MLLLATALLLGAPKPLTDYAALEKSFKASLPEGWKFISAREARFGGHHAKTCWLATLEASKAGDYYLVANIDHDPKTYPFGSKHSICRYHLGVGKPGTKRLVSDPRALPQCNVGDRLVIPIPVAQGDSNQKFSFTPVEKRQRWHSLGHQYRDQAFEARVEKPAFKVDNKAAKSLSLIKAESGTYTLLRSLDGDFKHRQKALLEAKAPGKLTIQAPIEIVPANAKITAWVGVYDHSRLREKPAKDAKDSRKGGGIHGFEFAGPPKWVMRVGDRLRVTFDGGPAKTKDEAPPKLPIPAGPYVEPKEPFDTWR